MTVAEPLRSMREGTVVDGVALTRAQAAALAATRLVSVTPTPDGWQVRASHLVGAITCGEIEVRVAPKVGAASVLRMLARVHGAHRLDVDAARVGLAADARISTVLAVLFEQEARTALAQGARRGYRTEDQSLPVLRGRLRIMEQSLRRFDALSPLEVTVDEWTLDTDENRLLRAAVRVLLRLPGIPVPCRGGLRRIDQRLGEVTRVPVGTRPPAWTPTRLNAHLHRLLHLADLVLDGASVEHRAGDVVAHGWVLDMAWLFEALVAEVLREHLHRGSVGRLRTQATHDLDPSGHLKIRPDVEIVSAGRAIAVADTKYKLLDDDGRFPNADAYQLLTYAARLALKDAHLIYAGAPGEVPAHYPITGAGVTLHVHAVDITRGLDEVEGQIRGLAPHLAAIWQRDPVGSA